MNLIICCTPLQVLIAEKIIDMNPEKQFFGVMLHTVENKKFDYYKQRLQAKTDGFFSMVQHNDRWNLLKEIVQLKARFSGKQFDTVYFANFPELHIQFLLSAIEFKQLNTFDDGTVNIVKHSHFLNDDPDTLVRKFINKVLGNKYSTATLRSLSAQHYTIYPDFPNIMPNTVAVNLIDNSIAVSESSESVNILLGQPVYNDNSQNIELVQKAIKQFNIHYYLPHPREKYQVEQVKYIDTPLILEDYIAQEFSERKCCVYTYCSSAILNIMNKSPNVEVVALRVESDDLGVQSCYDLFEQVGIQIIDMRD